MSDKHLVWEAAGSAQEVSPRFHTPERILKAIEDTFGPYPLILGQKDLPILEAMGRMTPEALVENLIELIRINGSIRIWIEGYKKPLAEDYDGAATMD